MSCVAVILGSAFDVGARVGWTLTPRVFNTPFGAATLHRVTSTATPGAREAWALFRHGRPHTLLPNQVNYRANAWALRAIGCGALLVTSSVGVLSREVPLHQPVALADLLTLDNRLPDGSACTMFPEPTPAHGHLVLNEGLFCAALTTELEVIAARVGAPLGPRAVFGYVGGPRTKTRAENRMWAALGAQVNSMTVAPEVILAAELGIACAGLVVGHKYSLGESPAVALDAEAVTRSLEASRASTERVIAAWLEHATPTRPGNHLYQFASSAGSSPADTSQSGV